VSNLNVRLRRLFFRSLVRLTFGLCAIVFLLLLVSQIEQHLFRRDAEHFLSALQSVELRKTPWLEAQVKFQPWIAQRETLGGSNDHYCIFQFTLHESVFRFISARNILIRLDDYIRWRFDLNYANGPFALLEVFLVHAYVHLGGRPARVTSTLEVRNGIVWAKSIDLCVESYSNQSEFSFSGNWGEYTLFAEARTVPRFKYYRFERQLLQLSVHPEYLIGAPGGCEGCVAGWVNFTPYAGPSDVHRFLELNLSCLTAWNPCRSQLDAMPNVWPQYQREVLDSPDIRKTPVCSPSIVKILGRDSSYSFVAEVIGFQEDSHSHDYDPIFVTVRVLEPLKAGGSGASESTFHAPIQPRTICSDPRIQVGTKLIFFDGSDRNKNSFTDPTQTWSTMPATQANLSSFRAGILADYRANDRATSSQ